MVVLFGIPSDNVLGHLLSFACGIMLYISYADMLPHSIEALGWFAANQWVSAPPLHSPPAPAAPATYSFSILAVYRWDAVLWRCGVVGAGT